MKKILLNLLFLLTINNSFAKNGFYLGGNFKYANHNIGATYEVEVIGNPYYIEANKEDDNFLFGISAGYKHYYASNLSISPEFNINLSNTTFNNKKVLDKKIQDLYSFSIKFGYDINKQMSIFVLGGFSQFKNILSSANYSNITFEQQKEITIDLGFGLEYYLNDKISLNASYILKEYGEDFSYYINSMNYEILSIDNTISMLNFGLNYYF